MTAPAGTKVNLSYRWKGDPTKWPRKGDVLKTSTGRRYMILGIGDRRSATSPMRLEALVLNKDDKVPRGARIYEFKWDTRERRRR
jgi:hypothetical protein